MKGITKWPWLGISFRQFRTAFTSNPFCLMVCFSRSTPRTVILQDFHLQ